MNNVKVIVPTSMVLQPEGYVFALEAIGEGSELADLVKYGKGIKGDYTYNVNLTVLHCIPDVGTKYERRCFEVTITPKKEPKHETNTE